MQKRRPTIRDVAAEARVSAATVSLVMSGKGYVRPETRERVLRAAHRLGYVPTRAAQVLVSRKTGNVGFVLREDHFTRSEPFYTRIFLGAEFEARQQNYYVLLTTIPRTYDPERHVPRFLLERNVDGVLIAGKVDIAFVEQVEAAGLPLVLIDFEVGQRPAVVIDNVGGARAAVQHLFARGHRRVAFVGADMSHPSIAGRLDGYRLAFSAAGLAFEPDWIIAAPDREPTRATGLELGRRLLALPERPSAVFCANDALALGVLDAAEEAGLRLPQELAVVGFDDVDGAASARPPLTTVRVFKEQLGELALRYLLELLEEKGASAPRYARRQHAISVPTELVLRATS
ncbi:MAG: LacI family transcriptional regulator [Bacteroidetes bacterium]|nr:LacI family transcriptional regulator [Rhodothermia bacterium]MCS7155944.1 LacI family transcriptional regulator [Bacteroidota bacterium]MCX7905950.1 LacI family transcriptional regulator [Bacteroidota bacterium]MDW8138083.1 LacI family DNA-binding transcriptional regulator [Bacteroidota bacterium]MDW8285767.1 LacI family DNA-binding transcriptional regulator [Bacteroidota bacterium]